VLRVSFLFEVLKLGHRPYCRLVVYVYGDLCYPILLYKRLRLGFVRQLGVLRVDLYVEAVYLLRRH
jgi:hypothetical protein